MIFKKILNKKKNYQFLQRGKDDRPYLICDISKVKSKTNRDPKYSKVSIIFTDKIKWSKYLIKNNFIRKFTNV